VTKNCIIRVKHDTKPERIEDIRNGKEKEILKDGILTSLRWSLLLYFVHKSPRSFLTLKSKSYAGLKSTLVNFEAFGVQSGDLQRLCAGMVSICYAAQIF